MPAATRQGSVPRHASVPPSSPPVSKSCPDDPPTTANASSSSHVETTKAGSTSPAKRESEPDQQNAPSQASVRPPAGSRATSEPPVSKPVAVSTGLANAPSTVAEEEEPTPAEPDKGQALIDMTIFDQIIELDDDGEFAKSVVQEYFEQARKTFDEMDDVLRSGNFIELGKLGHFLKGSSAALGVLKVQATCEMIQGAKKHAALKDKARIDAELQDFRRLRREAEAQFEEAEQWFKETLEL